MKKLLFILLILSSFYVKGDIHQIQVWNGYYQFLPPNNITVQLGDTVQWVQLDPPTMTHTITSDNIPNGAIPFDQIWQLPADTFFQYIPQVVGLYQYVCTPHLPFGMIGEFTVVNGLQTYVPDDNFELALINLGYDILLDDYVMTANIDTITYLDVSFENISDLTGIEAFVNLTELLTSDNQLINLDISNNTALIDLQCGTNQLESLDVSNNPNLLWIRCYENQLTSLDLSNNTSLKSLECRSNQLTTLDVNGATSLTDLICYSNNLTTLDLSSNIELISLDFAYNQISSINVSNNEDLINLGAENNLLNSIDVSNNTKLENLICYSNQLLSADVRNGNNQNAEWYMFSDNPNLECISVDNPTYSTNNWLVSFGMIDSTMYFSSNCSLPALIIEANTTNKELLKVTDLLGRETKQTNQPLFYIYDDGTVEKRIVIE